MNGIILIGAAFFAAGLTFAANSRALNPWRRNKDKHWSEQARLVHPVIVAMRTNSVTVPIAFALATALLWPEKSYLWLYAGVIAGFACNFAMIPIIRELFPRISLPQLFRLMAIACLKSILFRIVFILAAVAMPPEFNVYGLALGGTVLLLWLLWSLGGMTQFGLRSGILVPAPQRLRNIVENTANKMGVEYRDVFLVRLHIAQAAALPLTGHLFFTERLLEILTDEEVSTICAHELAHLTESRKDGLFRLSISSLMWLPWLFFNPLVHFGGIQAFYLLLVNIVVASLIRRHFSHRLEIRADGMAAANQTDDGTYAQALLKLYRDSYAPAVNSRPVATHPHLYDRMIAAGLTPDFPRPLPPAKISWNGRMFSISMGLLLGIFAARFVESL